MSEEMSVLLIEDNPDDALIVKKMLEKCCKPEINFLTTVEESLASALKRIEEEHFQLIVTDLNLPDSSKGIDTYLRVREKQPNIPIVICSSMDDQSLALDAIRHGASDYIVKGQVNKNDLERVIRFTMERRRLQELKEEFIGMIVHDMRNPLAVMSMSVENLMQGALGTLSPIQMDFLKLTAESGERLGRLVGNMLDSTSVELGKLSLHRKKEDFGKVTKRVCDGLQLLAHNKGLELRLQLPKKTVELWIDAEKIEQVWMNLISNAIKFTAKGFVDVALKEEKESILCTVTDSGRGIPEKVLPFLFSKYQKMDHQGTSGEKGTGLGLAITKGIVTAHHGKIWAENLPGQGSRFSFTLPQKKA